MRKILRKQTSEAHEEVTWARAARDSNWFLVAEVTVIFSALLGLGFTAWGLQEQITTNRATLNEIEQSRLHRETVELPLAQRTLKEMEAAEIARAWTIIGTKASGNSGKIEALRLLASHRIALVGIDLSCEAMGGGSVIVFGFDCSRPTYLEGLSLGADEFGKTIVLREANFSDANLAKSDLSGADLSHADFNGANLDGANLSGAILAGAKFGKASLQGTVFDGVQARGANFESANLTGSSFVNAHLHSSRFTEAQMETVDFSSAELIGADFRAANVRSANLVGANFDSADLTSAILALADITDASFRNANVSLANFSFVKNQTGEIDGYDRATPPWAWSDTPPLYTYAKHSGLELKLCIFDPPSHNILPTEDYGRTNDPDICIDPESQE